MLQTEFKQETDFQEWCNGVLDKLKVHYVHVSSKNKFVRKGILDLLCWYKKRSFIIELKVKGNYLSKEQKKEMEGFVHHDIPVYVVFTPDEFLKVLERELGYEM